jgi:hypothetical protein
VSVSFALITPLLLGSSVHLLICSSAHLRKVGIFGWSLLWEDLFNQKISVMREGDALWVSGVTILCAVVYGVVLSILYGGCEDGGMWMWRGIVWSLSTKEG